MPNKPYLIPLAIVIAGALIAGALFFRTPPAQTASPNQNQTVSTLNKLAAIQATEHVRGDLNAPIKIIEFADLECPYCKVFHLAMQDLMNKYGESGKVAWIYRHFPLDKGPRPLHPKAGPEAVAAECVAKLGGNDKFWQYIDEIFAITPSNNRLDLSLLPKLAVELGIDQSAFNRCSTTDQVKSVIDAQYQDGVNVGVDGTPFVIMVGANNQKFLVFRDTPPTSLDADTKAIMNDLYTFEEAALQKVSQGQNSQG